MLKKLKQLYRMDAVPFWIWPFWMLYGIGFGGALYLWSRCMFYMTKIEQVGKPPERNAIFCIWHHAWMYYFVTTKKHKNHVWMNHPFWYMIHIWFLVRFIGVKRQILGSAGNDGRHAADLLAEALKAGASTVITPDGPGGPPMKLKHGAVHLSLQTGVPIVPIKYTCEKYWVLPSWDGKRVPFPFGKIRVEYGAPIYVKSLQFQKEEEELIRGM